MENDNIITLIDTFDTRSYEEFVEYCKDENWDVKEENLNIPSEDSNDYYYWRISQREYDIEDFFEEIRQKDNEPIIITGTLGLWNGNKDIYATPISYSKHYANVLEEGIYKCIDKCNEFRVDYNQTRGELYVTAYHHDGRNYFTINLLSKKGIDKMENICWESFNGEIKAYWIKKYNFFN